MGTSKAVAAAVLAAAAGVLTACGAPTGAEPTPAPAVVATPSPDTTASQPPETVYVLPPPTRTVFVPPAVVDDGTSGKWYAEQSWIDAQPWIPITASAGQTDCQWLHASGYSYADTFAAWAQRGYPANWSATNNGYPCQRSYGMQH